MSWKLDRIVSGTKCRIILSNIAVELSRFAEDFPLTYPIDETYDVSID
ncbi:hypothetical protein VCRA2113O23_40389 [Vibrio crassostreae]|nr:hypothetical protein VCRA2113O23_40389 [Vibrio crassostreae]